MKILVMGAGALGGYFGARLAFAGHDVTFVARGAHLEAMQKQGLRIESRCGDIRLSKVKAVEDVSKVETPDVVMLMVKTYDVEAAAIQLKPVLGPETLIVSCQNGVSAPDRIASVVGAGRVTPCVVYMPASIKEPGVIFHPAEFHRIGVGELDGSESKRIRAFADAVNASGPDCTISADIRATFWEKLIPLASLSAITCLTRLDIGPVRDTPSTRRLLLDAIDEAHAVARAVCPTVSAQAGAKARAILLEELGRDTHASMQDDLMRGKRLELNDLSGEIVRFGARHNVPTPFHSFATAALQPFVDGTPS